MARFHFLLLLAVSSLLLGTTDAYLPGYDGKRLQARADQFTQAAAPNPADAWPYSKLSASELSAAQELNKKLTTAINKLSADPIDLDAVRASVQDAASGSWSSKLPNGPKVDARLNQAKLFVDIPESGPRYAIIQLSSLQNDFIVPAIRSSSG
ncbi:hypothetical protein THASP1DRAFT_28203 [Thamnocephalis sphaerospora]|uniref:Uncharacterized protein n=1 Tax=Thamnocephalis sphaerospora TaxID=78915 RepID=A0A4P9XUV8_9FUNG|nr:hypothetical protein THASP1DRAFT_28203 [Thamnocephalis sphaerospora]|eukprot:RKP10018.1 hypothetical protein THASP1DRAFT_28203 [Thamnocephalis sphaerospora]